MGKLSADKRFDNTSKYFILVLSVSALIFLSSFAISFFVSSANGVARLASIEARNLQVRHVILFAVSLIFFLILVSLLSSRLSKIGLAAATLGLAFGLHLGVKHGLAKNPENNPITNQVHQSAATLPPIDAEDRSKDRWWPRGSAEDAFWAAEVLKGGYILHFRHAHRNMDNQRYGDTIMFDALDMLEGFRGVETSWDKSICLNEAGERQAIAAAEIFKFVQLPVQTVISSPSCRAVQTANLAFGRVDQVNRGLHFRLLFDEKGRRNLDGELKALFEQISKDGQVGNIVLVGHNGTLGYLGPEFTLGFLKPEFTPVDTASIDIGREEMGFTVLSVGPSGEIIIHHEFKMLRHFVLAATADLFR